MRVAALRAVRSSMNLAFSSPKIAAKRPNEMLAGREVEVKLAVSPLVARMAAAISQNRAANRRRVDILDVGLVSHVMFQYLALGCAFTASPCHIYVPFRGITIPFRYEHGGGDGPRGGCEVLKLADD